MRVASGLKMMNGKEASMAQSELKEKYMEIIRTEVWAGSPRMQDYARDEFCYAVELANGDIHVIGKPRINKDFCFGYGMNGICFDDDMDRASDAAEHARTSESWFIRENLKDINERIDRLTDPRLEGYKFCNYSGQPSGSKLKTYRMVDYWSNPSNDPCRWSRMTDVERLTDDEIKAIVAGYQVVKETFTKRLKTYLKRYGLTKVNTWTYLRD